MLYWIIWLILQGACIYAKVVNRIAPDDHKGLVFVWLELCSQISVWASAAETLALSSRFKRCTQAHLLVRLLYDTV